MESEFELQAIRDLLRDVDRTFTEIYGEDWRSNPLDSRLKRTGSLQSRI